jgi:hypothetical protein
METSGNLRCERTQPGTGCRGESKLNETMKTAIKVVLNGKVHGLVFVTICLVMGGLVAAALEMAWDIQAINDKELQQLTFGFPS